MESKLDFRAKFKFGKYLVLDWAKICTSNLNNRVMFTVLEFVNPVLNLSEEEIKLISTVEFAHFKIVEYCKSVFDRFKRNFNIDLINNLMW